MRVSRSHTAPHHHRLTLESAGLTSAWFHFLTPRHRGGRLRGIEEGDWVKNSWGNSLPRANSFSNSSKTLCFKNSTRYFFLLLPDETVFLISISKSYPRLCFMCLHWRAKCTAFEGWGWECRHSPLGVGVEVSTKISRTRSWPSVSLSAPVCQGSRSTCLRAPRQVLTTHLPAVKNACPAQSWHALSTGAKAFKSLVFFWVEILLLAFPVGGLCWACSVEYSFAWELISGRSGFLIRCTVYHCWG